MILFIAEAILASSTSKRAVKRMNNQSRRILVNWNRSNIQAILQDTEQRSWMHRRYVLHRVVGPAHDEIAHASNAVGDAGNVVVMVLGFPTNVACRESAQRGLETVSCRLCRAAGTRPWCWAPR